MAQGSPSEPPPVAEQDHGLDFACSHEFVVAAPIGVKERA